MGELNSAGGFADLVSCVACSSTSAICVESTDRTVFASVRVKRRRWEKSGRIVRALAKTELDVGNQISELRSEV